MPNSPVLIIPGFGQVRFHQNNLNGTPKQIFPCKTQIEYDSFISSILSEIASSPDTDLADIFSEKGIYFFDEKSGLAALEVELEARPSPSLALATKLESLGFVPGLDLFAFPYNYFLSPDHPLTLESLESKINTIAAELENVDIITVGSGGLVMKALLQRNDKIPINSWTALQCPFEGLGADYLAALFGHPHKLIPFSRQFRSRSILSIKACYYLFPPQLTASRDYGEALLPHVQLASSKEQVTLSLRPELLETTSANSALNLEDGDKSNIFLLKKLKNFSKKNSFKFLKKNINLAEFLEGKDPLCSWNIAYAASASNFLASKMPDAVGRDFPFFLVNGKNIPTPIKVTVKVPDSFNLGFISHSELPLLFKHYNVSSQTLSGDGIVPESSSAADFMPPSSITSSISVSANYFDLSSNNETISFITKNLYLENSDRTHPRIISKRPSELKLPPHGAVILVPGVAGSVLRARNKRTGEDIPLWMRAQGVESVYKNIFYGSADAETGEWRPFNPEWEIYAPQKDHGLYAVSCLMPDMPKSIAQMTGYFLKIRQHLEAQGYRPGVDLFGYPYVWVSAITHGVVVNGLYERCKQAYLSTGRRCHLVGHSLGCAVVRSLLLNYPDASKYIKSFCAIAPAYSGGSAYLLKSIIGGYNLRLPEFVYPNHVFRQLNAGACYPLLPDTSQELDDEMIFVKKPEGWIAFSCHIPDPTRISEKYFSMKEPIQPKLLDVCEENEVTQSFLPLKKTKNCDRDMPWEKDYEKKHLFELWFELHHDETKLFGSEIADLYNFRADLWDKICDQRSRVASLESLPEDFSFGEIIGKDVPTPIYAVYNKTINRASELLSQNPEYVMSDGDGTVLYSNAIKSGFPEKFKKMSKVMPGVGHFNIILVEETSELLFNWFMENDGITI